MNESRRSAEKLLALHEEEKKRLEAEYERRAKLYNQGQITRADLDQTERALGEAIVRVEEDKRWISEAEGTIKEALAADANLNLPNIQNKQESSAAKDRR